MISQDLWQDLKILEILLQVLKLSISNTQRFLKISEQQYKNLVSKVISVIFYSSIQRIPFQDQTTFRQS